MSTSKMVNVSMPVASEKKIPWPDMSAYGIFFGIAPSLNGRPCLIMIDNSGTFTNLAKSIGFNRTRWYGIWVKPGLEFTIPQMKRNFPLGNVVMRSAKEIYQEIQNRLATRKNVRISQMSQHRMGWHPERMSTATDKFAAMFAGIPQVQLDAQTLLRQTIHIGYNFNGSKVYERGDGVRFISNDGLEVIETETIPSARFLRLDSDGPIACADGMIHEMLLGHCLKSGDFERYLTAIYGEDALDDPSIIAEFQSAIDKSIIEHVKQARPEDTYRLAVKLHNNRPSYWRPPGSMPTPAPIIWVMQDILANTVDHQARLIDCQTNPVSCSWQFGSVLQVTPNTEIMPNHKYFIGASLNHAINTQRIGSLSISRLDHAMIVRSLEQRDPDGVSIFLTAADEGNGKIVAETRRLLNWLGTHYQVIGIADIGSNLISAGNLLDHRLIVIGKRHKERDLSYSLPVRINVLRDFDALSRWGAIIKERINGITVDLPAEAADTEVSDMVFQVPYIPASQVTEPAMMTPRNLLEPIRSVLADIMEKSGKDIDSFVAEKLGFTVESLGSRFSAEQIDAIAIGIRAIDDRSGFIEADQTGVGKGRVLAALMYYSRLIGKMPVFLTENTDLYTALYRDIQDIGVYEHFRKPFILNNNERLVDPDNNVVARSPRPEEVEDVLMNNRLPEGYDCILATYSQFNRDVPSEKDLIENKLQKIIRSELDLGRSVLSSIRKAVEETDCRNSYWDLGGVITSLSNEKVIDDKTYDLLWAAWQNGDDLQASHLINQITETVKNSNLNYYRKLEFIRKLLGEENRANLAEKLDEMKLDNMSLRQAWIRNIKDFVMIADESHNMAGPNSNINSNLVHAVKNAYAFVGSSATFASNEDNFGVYLRIFPPVINVDRIAETLKKGGEPLQEIFSGMVTKDGKMIRREHDMSNIDIQTFVDNQRLDRNRAWNDNLAEILNALSVVSGEIDTLIAKENEKLSATYKAAIQANPKAKIPKVGVNVFNFGSRFFALNQQFMMVINADHVADLAIQALQNGLKPVIYAENTLESTIRSLLLSAEQMLEDNAGDLDIDRVPVPNGKATFKHVLRNCANSMLSVVKVERQGKNIIRKTYERINDPNIDALLKAINEMIDKLPDIPLSSLDLIRDRITKAGFTIDEISNRRLAIEYGNDQDYIVKLAKQKKKTIRDRFNDGLINALIISKSGATGIDLHAAAKFKDQSQRVFIPIKPPIDIVKFVQAMGRVNRVDQVCAPIVYIPHTGLPAEKRHIIIFKQKMRRMSANVTANAENVSSSDYEAPDIINRVGNRICYEFLQENPDIARRLGFAANEISEEVIGLPATFFVDRLTNRITMLDCNTQEYVYQQIESNFLAYIARCEAEGWNPFHAHKLDIKAREIERRVILPGDSDSKSVFSGPVYASLVEWQGKPIKPAVSQDQMLEIIRSNRHAYLSKHLNGVAAAANLRKRAEKIVTSLLAEGETIESSLASSKPNRVKTFLAKIGIAEKLMPMVVPSNIYTIDKADGIEDVMIVDVDFPKDMNPNLAEYRLRVISDSHPRGAWIQFTSLMAVSDKIVKWSMHGDHDHEETLETFVRNRFAEKNRVMQRVMLTGNLYRAAEFASQMNKGFPAAYTDERGVWRQAIAMSSDLSLDDVMNMPIEVTDADMAIEYFRLVDADAFVDDKSMGSSVHKEVLQITKAYRFSLADTFAQDKRKLELIHMPNHGVYRIICTGDSGTFGWLFDNEELTNLAGGSFDGTIGNRYLEISEFSEKEMFQILIPLCKENGYPLLINTNQKIRDWYINRASRTSANMDIPVIEDDLGDLMEEIQKNATLNGEAYRAPGHCSYLKK